MLLFNYSVKQKLIASNTFDPLNHILLQPNDNNLKIWIQLRFKIIKIYSYNHRMLPIFRIADQQNNEQVNANIEFYANQVNMIFSLQNEIFKTHQIKFEENLEIQWILFQLNKEICFNQIIGPEGFIIEVQCNQAFDQILFLNQAQIFQILLYDQKVELGMFPNEYKQISNFPWQMEYYYSINAYCDNIQILSYVKFLDITNVTINIFKVLNNDFNLIISSQGNNLIIFLEKYDIKDLFFVSQLNNIINLQQWLLIDVQFNDQNILFQFHTHEQIIQSLFNPKQFYISMSDIEISIYRFQKLFQIINNNTIYDKILLMNNFNKSEKLKLDFCFSTCRNCNQLKCEDNIIVNCKKEQFFNSSNQQCQDILDSNIYDVLEFPNIKKCENNFFLLNNQTCKECPLYQGQYFSFCNYKNNMRQEFLIKHLCLFKQITFHNILVYIINQQIIPYQIYDLRFIQKCTMQFEKDLNIYLNRHQDPFRIYNDTFQNINYCELGYHYQQSCKINKKNCLFQIQNQCLLCKQLYSKVNNYCIKCQLNCLLCQIQNKRLHCILFKNTYFRNQNGLIKQCNHNSSILCYDKEQIIQILQNQGSEICQQNQIYQIQYQRCIDINQFSILYDISELRNIPIIIDQKLEIQDMLKLNTLDVSQSLKQINLLINLQQILKLSNLANEINNKLDNFFLETQDKNQKHKLILNDIQINLGFNPALINYQGQAYLDILDIYDQKIKHGSEWEVQFNIQIVFFGQKDQYNNVGFESIIQYENTNMTFIYNISFLQSPSQLLSNCFKIRLQASEIIFNGFSIQGSYIPEGCNSDYGFYLMAKVIKLSNLKFYQTNIIKIFHFYEFQQLLIKDIYFLESYIFQFMGAFTYSYKTSYQISIQNIILKNSIIQEILQVINVKNVELTNFIFIDSTLKQNQLILILGFTDNITIGNFWFFNVNIFQSILFEFDSNFLEVQHIYFCLSKFINSTILLAKSVKSKVGFLFFNQMQIENSEILKIYGHACDVYELNINIHLMNFSSFFKLDMQKNISFRNMYFQVIYGKFALISDTLSANFLLNNFNIIGQQLIKFKVFFILGSKAILQHILFGDYQQMMFEQIQFLIDIRADAYVSINGIKFFNLKSNDSGLIQLLSNKYVQINNIYIINSIIDIQNLQELILIKICKQAILQNVNLNNLVIKQHDRIFSIIFLYGRDLNYDTKVSYFHASMIQSNNNLFLIQNEFSQMLMEEIYLKNLLNVYFVISNSSYFTLNSCSLYNITNSNKNLAFIMNQITQEKTQILISNILTKFIQGTLLSIKTFKESLIHLENFIMHDCFLQQQETIFKILQNSINQDRNNSLIISNIQYINMVNIFKSVNIDYIFHIQFCNVYFNYIKLINTSQQVLLLKNNFKLIIKNFYIYNFTSQSQIVESLNASNNYYQQNHYYIQIINFTAKNSLNTVKSIFLIRPMENQNIIMKNLKIINTKVYETFVILNNFHHLFINLNEIILKNIEFGQSLFLTQGSQIYLENLDLYTSQISLIFNNQFGSVIFKNGFIINVQSNTNFFKCDSITLQSSEIVDSNIFSERQNIQLVNSQFQSGTNQNLMIYKFDQQKQQFVFLSLNEGKSCFEQKQIAQNVFQVYFSDDNNYLYLPSGRDISVYKYYNIKKQQYQQIYQSISIINKYYQNQNTLDCILEQKTDEIIVWQQQIQLKTEINVLQNITFTLNPLIKDKFIQFDVTCQYNEGNITLRTLIKTFNCQLGEYLFQNQCLQCDIEKQYYSIGYNQKYCQINYQDKIQELKVGKVKLYPNYWRFSISNKYIEQCNNQNCQGGWQTGDNSCQIGYIGAICKECDLNNIRGNGHFGKVNDTCQLCYFDNKIYLKGFCLIVWQLLLVYMSYYSTKQQSQQHLFLKISQRKFKEILISLNINQVTILIQLIWNYLFTIYLLKDAISFGYKIDVSLDFIYNPNLTTIPQQDCLIRNETNFSIQYTQLLVKTIFPIFLFNIFIIIYVVSVKITLQRFRIYVIIVSIISIYQQNQLIILQSLLKLSSKVKYSNIWWTIECVAIQFYSKTHQYYLFIIIIPLIALFIIFNIVACFWISYIHRKRQKYTQLSTFIYVQYKNSIYFWDYFRYSFIYLFMVLFYLTNQQKQLIIILSLIVLTINTKLKPFVLKNLNEIDQIILQFSIYSYFSILIIQKESSQMSLMILICSNLTLIYFFICQFVFSWKIQYKRSFIQLVQRIQKKIPFLKQVISFDKHLKTQYYYSLLKQDRKKSDFNFSSIIQTQSSYQKPANSCEIELFRLQISQH